MSTALNSKVGTRTTFTITLNSLANVTYVAATAVDYQSIAGVTSGTVPLDVIIELGVTPGTVAGNKQALLFAQISMDNTNFSSGPSSGTTTTDQPDLYLLGVLPLNSNAVLQTKSFSVVAALGFMPRAIKPVIFNDSGAALAGSGCTVFYTIVTGDST